MPQTSQNVLFNAKIRKYKSGTAKKKQFSTFLTTLHSVFAELLYKENRLNKMKGFRTPKPTRLNAENVINTCEDEGKVALLHECEDYDGW